MVDCEFDITPPLNSALKVGTLTLETALILSDHLVRAIAMGPTDGLVRGMQVTTDGNPISVPVGEATLGRIFNVLGEVVDEGPPVATTDRQPIHKLPPSSRKSAPSSKCLRPGSRSST